MRKDRRALVDPAEVRAAALIVRGFSTPAAQRKAARWQATELSKAALIQGRIGRRSQARLRLTLLSRLLELASKEGGGTLGGK